MGELEGGRCGKDDVNAVAKECCEATRGTHLAPGDGAGAAEVEGVAWRRILLAVNM